MAEYRFSPAAQRDLGEVFDYGVANWDRAQAMDYTDLIAAACAELAEAPLRAPACDHIRPGYRRRGVARHVIYFRPTDYGIAVIRILHQRMDVGRRL